MQMRGWYLHGAKGKKSCAILPVLQKIEQLDNVRSAGNLHKFNNIWNFDYETKQAQAFYIFYLLDTYCFFFFFCCARCTNNKFQSS